jgi:hypothetical protein
MNKIKLALLVLLFGSIKICFAQNDTIYFDKKWKECTKDSSAYYRVFGLENYRDMVTDYQRNGTVQMKARISQRVPLIVDGICMYYSETGKLESKGLYQLNKKLGNWVYYDQVGNDSSIVEHFLNEPKKEIKVTCEYKQYDAFIFVEVMPEFPGGEKGMFDYIRKFIENQYSGFKEKSKLGFNGTVYVYFIVNTFGKAVNAKIVRSAGKDIDEIVIKAIEEMPLWKPGTQNGFLANVKFTYPIKINFKP